MEKLHKDEKCLGCGYNKSTQILKVALYREEKLLNFKNVPFELFINFSKAPNRLEFLENIIMNIYEVEKTDERIKFLKQVDEIEKDNNRRIDLDINKL